MSQLVRDLPISRKLNLLVVVSTTISLLLAALGILVLDLFLVTNSVVNDLKAQARLVADTVSVGLSVDFGGDLMNVSEMPELFGNNPTIMEAALFDKSGKLIKNATGEEGDVALYRRDTNRPFNPPADVTNLGGYQDRSLVVSVPIAFEGEHLGYVFIRSDLSNLRTQVYSHLRFMAGVFLASFGLAYLVSQRFQSFVADPIKSLARKTAEISDSGDYSLRQEKTSADEIGELTDAFNEMLEAIQKRDQELSSTLEELKVRDAELVLARDKAEEATRAKSEFLAHMSHEIRTPMNGILGMTNIALKTKLTDSQREYLSAVKTSADALLLVINEILDFSKIEAGHLELDPIPFDFEDCLADAIKSVTLQAHLKNLELGCRIDSRLPRTLIGDPARLRQVIINLVGNALKFTKEGSVSLSVKLLEDLGDELRLECRVIDTGIGIPKDRQDKVFESFTQADSSTSRNFGGTGLGLTITALLVEMMGGKIWVESEVGVGSEFVFTAILGKTEAVALSAVDQAAQRAAQGKVVAIVCEDDLHAEALANLLSSYGAVPLRSSAEELSRLIEAEEKPVAVLADADLPGGGLRLLADLSDRGFENTGILLRSAKLSDDITHYRSLGVRGHLLKPVRRRDVGELLLRWLAPAEAQSLLEHDETAGRKFSELKVMVCDDNQINRQLARILLEGFGCQVEEAESGEKVLELLGPDGKGFPDVLLLDIMMPGMDGFECTRQTRLLEKSLGRESRLPIIALTAHALKGYEEKCLAADMDGYLSKPIAEDKMFEVLAKHWPDRELPPELANRPKGEAAASSAPEPAAEEEQEAAPAELKVMDLDVSLKRVGGNMAILKAVVGAFLGASTAQLAEVEKAVVDNAAEPLRFAAHTFKGTVLNFEARKTAAVAQALEDMGARNELEGAAELLEELKACYQELRLEMEKI